MRALKGQNAGVRPQLARAGENFLCRGTPAIFLCHCLFWCGCPRAFPCGLYDRLLWERANRSSVDGYTPAQSCAAREMALLEAVVHSSLSYSLVCISIVVPAVVMVAVESEVSLIGSYRFVSDTFVFVKIGCTTGKSYQAKRIMIVSWRQVNDNLTFLKLNYAILIRL